MHPQSYAFHIQIARIQTSPEILFDIKWRHHHLGMLQGYLDKDVRVHIWHPALRANVDDPLRMVHDHRYDISSEVLLGSIQDVSYEVWPYEYKDDGERISFMPCGDAPFHTSLWTILNAKEQEKHGIHADEVSKCIGAVWVRETGKRIYQAGDSYTIPRRAFHSTIPGDRLSVTIIRRTNYDEHPARVLGSRALSGMEFAPTETQMTYVKAAVEELENMP